MILFRPIGPNELALIRDSGWRAFPPRLPDQPIFYPVLNFPYAEQIARDWNSTDSQSLHLGFVTEFDVVDSYVSRFDVKIVGGGRHQELWVPAEDLAEFNRHIAGNIRVAAAYRNGVRIDDFDLADL